MKFIEALRSWLYSLERRERYFVSVGAIAVLLSVVYLGAIQPLVQHHRDLERRVIGLRNDINWMREAAQEMQNLGYTGQVVQSTGDLLTDVDAAARKTKLGSTIQRIEQDPSGAIRVRLEAASFDELMRWLIAMQQGSGIVAGNVALERGEQAGRVNATLTLARQGN